MFIGLKHYNFKNHEPIVINYNKIYVYFYINFSQDFREFMKENRLAPASPAVAEMAPQQPIQRGKKFINLLYIRLFSTS